MRLRRRTNGTPEVRLSLRAAGCLSAPLVVGLIFNQRLYAIVFAIGALWAISQDGLDEFSVRGPRLLWVAAAGAAGVALGAIFVDENSAEWSHVALFAAVALVAGVIEASNRASQGAYLLIGTILGAGLGFVDHVWQSCLLIALGGLWVYLVAALTDRRKHLANQRVFLSHAFAALAGLVERLGAAKFYELRASSVATLDAAQDVIGAPMRTDGVEEIALGQCLVVALRCGEVISYLEGKGLPADPRVAPALRELGSVLDASSAVEAVTHLRHLRERFDATPGLHPMMTAALRVVGTEELRTDARRTTRRGVRRATRPLLPLVERVRFGLLLALASVTATVIAAGLDGPHGFWLPLAVAFILRPDLGPVVTRALARTVGTVIGVGIAVLVTSTDHALVVLIVLSCVMAAIEPWAARKSHVLAVIAFTPIVFVFLSLLGGVQYLFVPRVVDTAIGAAIVLALDVVLWSRAPSLRPAPQLAMADDAVARYEHEATLDDPLRRHLLRRRALRAIARARGTLQQTRREPRWLGRHEHGSMGQLDAIEARVDAHTVSLLEREPA